MGIPAFSHHNHLLLFRNSLCRGKLKEVLTIMAPSLSANCQTLSVNRAQTPTRKGKPVSLIFRNMVVMTMIASPIQNKTKKPRKSR